MSVIPVTLTAKMAYEYNLVRKYVPQVAEKRTNTKINPTKSFLLRAVIRRTKDRVAEPFLERGIVAELLEQLCMVGQKINHHPLKDFVVFDSSVLFVGVHHRVLIRGVGTHLGGNFFGNHRVDFIGVFPADIAEQVIERPNNVAQLIQFRFPFVAAAARRNRLYFRILVTVRSDDAWYE